MNDKAIRVEPYSLPVDFIVEHEKYDREHFQGGGHFVCGLTDANGFRRPWQGDEVHVLTLRYGTGPLQDLQLLRVMADSQAEAERLMQRAIRDTLRALWQASQCDQTLSEQWRALNEQRNLFQRWLDSQYSEEIEHGEHGRFANVFETAKHYMSKERRRLSVQAREWIKGKK